MGVSAVLGSEEFGRLSNESRVSKYPMRFATDAARTPANPVVQSCGPLNDKFLDENYTHGRRERPSAVRVHGRPSVHLFSCRSKSHGRTYQSIVTSERREPIRARQGKTWTGGGRTFAEKLLDKRKRKIRIKGETQEKLAVQWEPEVL